MAAALIAVLVAAPGASAATFDGGTFKIDFKTFLNAKKGTATFTGANPKTKTAGTFPLGTGQVTNNKQPTGNLSVGASTSKIAIKVGKKTVTLSSFTYKWTTGKGALNAVVGGKGKAVTMFDVASQGKVGPDSGFTQMIQPSSNVQLTKSGAAAINKALGLKAPAKGKKDPRVKAKQKVATLAVTADRSLTVLSGTSQTIYDQAFVNALRNCSIELSAVSPATPIAKDASAPEGGVNLPIRGNNSGGALTAAGLVGQVNHDGGTSLDRPASNSSGKAEYHSPLTNFVFGFGPPPFSLTAFVVNSNNNLPIGTVTGDLSKTLTEEGGSVTLSNGSLNLSDAASGTLSQSAPPLGADCPIPAGSKIGAVNMTAAVS